MNLDMHFHSRLSDWWSSSLELIKIWKDRWLEFMFLTDHDRISGNSFKNEAKNAWIHTCESVEISAIDNHHNQSLHLTFYAKNISWKIIDILDNTVSSKLELTEKQVKLLKEFWFKIELIDLYAYFDNQWRSKDSLNKHDIAIFLYLNEENREIIKRINWWKELTLEQFYKKYFRKVSENYFSVIETNYKPEIELFREIKESNNWVLSLAHPNFIFSKWINEFEDKIEYYVKKWWVNAIEINSSASKEWVNAILDASKKYKLYLTFWSDCHYVWFSDSQHQDLWVMNPYISDNMRKKKFLEYSELLWI